MNSERCYQISPENVFKQPSYWSPDIVDNNKLVFNGTECIAIDSGD